MDTSVMWMMTGTRPDGIQEMDWGTIPKKDFNLDKFKNHTDPKIIFMPKYDNV